jgi:DNA invertase Pin-like site-specific DNA recombinase
MTKAVAYYRTSSATNVGADKDSERRQRDAVHTFAEAHGFSVDAVFYDAAVSGADPVDERQEFRLMLDYCEAHGVHTILVENAGRFARDLAVQLAGHALLKRAGIDLVPVDAPTFFTDPSPTAVMVQQILGAVAQFEKAALVAKLKVARDRKRAETGRCGGPQPVPPVVIGLARAFRLRGYSLRAISSELDLEGYTNHNGAAYSASSIKNMLGRS